MARSYASRKRRRRRCDMTIVQRLNEDADCLPRGCPRQMR